MTTSNKIRDILRASLNRASLVYYVITQPYIVPDVKIFKTLLLLNFMVWLSLWGRQTINILAICEI